MISHPVLDARPGQTSLCPGRRHLPTGSPIDEDAWEGPRNDPPRYPVPSRHPADADSHFDVRNAARGFRCRRCSPHRSSEALNRDNRAEGADQAPRLLDSIPRHWRTDENSDGSSEETGPSGLMPETSSARQPGLRAANPSRRQASGAAGPVAAPAAPPQRRGCPWRRAPAGRRHRLGRRGSRSPYPLHCAGVGVGNSAAEENERLGHQSEGSGSSPRSFGIHPPAADHRLPLPHVRGYVTAPRA
jgi:hypothetical protein